MKRYDIQSHCGCRLIEDESQDGNHVSSAYAARIITQRDRLAELLRLALYRIDSRGDLSLWHAIDAALTELDKEKQS